MATVRDVVTDALREIGVLAAGEVPTADEADSAFDALNDMVDQWAAERLLVYTVTRTTWTITASTQTYAVGTGSVVNVARPVFINAIKYIDTATDPDTEYPLDALTDDAWSRVTMKAQTATLPSAYYYNPTYPTGTITLWPNPTSTTLLGALYAPTAVPQFASLDTAIALPPGYKTLLVSNLAVDLASSYERDPRPGLREAAADAKAIVKRANKRLIDMSIEAGALIQSVGGRATYDINTGP